MTDTARTVPLAEILEALLSMESEAYARFNQCMASLGPHAAMDPLASQHCEIHRIEARAYRKARQALAEKFEA